MEVVAEELCTLVATMAIKNGKVADWYLRMKFQVLNALVGVFHTLTLTNVAYDTCIEALDLEL